MPCPAAVITNRLTRLRQLLTTQGLDGFILPRADQFQGEYVPPHAERLQWLTGFSGSAGVVIVLPTQAALFTDGRYTLQVRQECNAALFSFPHLVEEPPAVWLKTALRPGQRLGFDPWLHVSSAIDALQASCSAAGAELIPCPDNPVDTLWTDRPAPSAAPWVSHPLLYAGEDSASKRQRIAAGLRRDGVNAAVISAPDALAWLLNIRGADVPMTPLPLAFALLEASTARLTLFAPPGKVPSALRQHLGEDICLADPAAFGLALAQTNAGQKILLDQATAADWIRRRLLQAGAIPVLAADPCSLPKACKNPVELEGSAAAHRRDGAALVCFLHWLDLQIQRNTLPTELETVAQLESCRRNQDLYRGPSFPTIAAAGPHGAIVHYRPQPGSNRRLQRGAFLLLDSGGQYLDGTTDCTRTIAVGPVSAEMRRRWTLVLKGHIALARVRFPAGTSGSQLDTLARAPLWAEGLDYDHGTGHGVGSYLSVHEGPARISKLPGSPPLRPGMILSNEPGYYQTGDYGIRLENLQHVTASGPAAQERPMLAFAPLTLVPFDRTALLPDLLEPAERDWLNSYHARCRAALTPLLPSGTADWLEKVTQEI